MAKSTPPQEPLKAGLNYLDDILRTAWGTHDKSVREFTKYSKVENFKHARQASSKFGVQSGAREGGKRTVNIITEAAEDYIRDRVTGKPTGYDGTYINLDDAKNAVKAQVDEAMNVAKKIASTKYASGVKAGQFVGQIAGAQRVLVAAKDAAPKLVAQGVKQGVKATLGPAAIAGMVVMEVANKGFDKAKTNPSFFKGKAGKSYLDLSINKPGKYGVDY